MDARLQILKDAFENRFNPDRFLRFTREFFGGVKIIRPDIDKINIPNEYRFTIDSYRHIAFYSSSGSRGDTLDVFSVKLRSGGGRTVERARSMQRSFISKLLSNTGHDGAIAAFYTDDDPRWRLSFIRLDYEFQAGRVKMELTPAKRYSYLVGENEPCHTAMEQLFPIFHEENYEPTLDRIEEAFSVERVTKDFFEQYRLKYFVLKDHLDNSEVFNDEAVRCGFTSEQFAKKLMGQLAFLYFLQKKGWLGISVLPHKLTEKEYRNAFYTNRASREIIPQIYKSIATDEYRLNVRSLRSLSDADADIVAGCFKTDEWGKGEKRFIRHLFRSCKSNFHDEYLEPLFYEALNIERGKNHFFKRFNCKIPFLNGGLFEPLEGFDWRYSKFEIPNEFFSNIDEKGERSADGILDIFDRYNFTMNEDEPLEREVAVDPEMLGKIFENLLDVKDRKSKGAFYTPREIVHYMCAESLINYLAGKTSVPYEDVKVFIIDGEFLKDEDYWSKGKRKLPKSVFDKLDEIDNALKTIRVADPAVGSGAFPLGMLSEIVKARITISYYKAGQISYPYKELKKQHSERRRVFELYDPYRLKWDTIQNCIFAVDIEASAVDIAKLRLWLSLVVEEDLAPSEEEKWLGITKQKDPHPLPNLDYNIMCGNSLIDEFDGVKLFDDDLPKKNQSKLDETSVQLSFLSDNLQMFLDNLRREQDRYFGEQTPSVKQDIRKKIDNIIDNIIRDKFERDNNTESLRKYEESLKQKSRFYFLWKLEFARVFRENGGFDVIIGNPPYIHLEHIKDQSAFYKSLNFSTYEARGDIYSLFYEKGVQLLKENGFLCFITSNKWMRAAYGKSLRRFFVNNTNPIQLVDFAGQQIFDATVDTNIILLSKSDNENSTKAVIVKDKESTNNLSVYIKQNCVTSKFDTDDSWAILSPIEQSIKAKIEAIGTPLKDWNVKINRGILTGCNEAFIISGEKRDEILLNCKTDCERNSTVELIRPVLRGRDIRRYGYEWVGLYIIALFPSRRYNIEEYPAVRDYLVSAEWSNIIPDGNGKLKLEQTGSMHTVDGVTFAARKKTSNKWFETQDQINYWDDFSKQKIIWAETMRIHRDNTTDFPRFAFCAEPMFTDKTCFIAITEQYPYYILGFMNSEIGRYLLKRKVSILDDGGYLLQKVFLETILLPAADVKMMELIETFVLECFDSEHHEIREKIDNLFYHLFSFSEDEIRFIKEDSMMLSARR